MARVRVRVRVRVRSLLGRSRIMAVRWYSSVHPSSSNLSYNSHALVSGGVGVRGRGRGTDTGTGKGTGTGAGTGLRLDDQMHACSSHPP